MDIPIPVYTVVPVVTKRFFTCPTCNDGDFQIEHLFESAALQPTKPYKAGPWFCRTCAAAWNISVTADGGCSVTPEVNREVSVNCLVLLRSHHEDGPISLILKTQHSLSSMVADGAYEDSSSAVEFLYDENTCPTNYMRDVEGIVYDGDPDPHGVFGYVGVITVEEADRIAAKNPEIFGYDGNYEYTKGMDLLFPSDKPFIYPSDQKEYVEC